MSLKPVQPEEQVQKACQLGLTVLSAPETPIPGNLLDAIQSFKSLLGGIIQGTLFICEREAPKDGAKTPEEKVPPEESPVVKTLKKSGRFPRKKASKK